MTEMWSDPKFWESIMYLVVFCMFVGIMVAMIVSFGMKDKSNNKPVNPNHRLNHHRLQLRRDHDEEYNENEDDIYRVKHNTIVK